MSHRWRDAEYGADVAGGYAFCHRSDVRDETIRPAACTACGTELSSTAKFCSECGAAVASAAKPAEYKQVTVLFADVVHSMDIASAVGPERLRAASWFTFRNFIAAQSSWLRGFEGHMKWSAEMG